MIVTLPKTWKEKLVSMPIDSALQVEKRDACYAAIRGIKAEPGNIMDFTIRKVGSQDYVFRLKNVEPCQTKANP